MRINVGLCRYRWLRSMRRNGIRPTCEAFDAYMRIYDNQRPWCAAGGCKIIF